MGGEFGSLLAEVQMLWASVLVQIKVMLLPSRLTQAAILTGCLGAAWLIRRWLSDPIYNWMRGLEGRPKWQLRTLLVLYRRMMLILFVTSLR